MIYRYIWYTIYLYRSMTTRTFKSWREMWCFCENHMQHLETHRPNLGFCGYFLRIAVQLCTLTSEVHLGPFTQLGLKTTSSMQLVSRLCWLIESHSLCCYDAQGADIQAINVKLNAKKIKNNHLVLLVQKIIKILNYFLTA